ncbi:unnamed protein product [Adineta steineri]|uniref:Uncharacterized protein n=1 Tax=Adineta steineri TaxID=433720 RepID=A0A813S901_9BILA|nr:unnamed protein product [Adineta steineri]CAF0893904.1 unnamed protein product [Adineta steineri]
MTTTLSPKYEPSTKRSETANSRVSFVPSTYDRNYGRHNKLYRCPRTPPDEVQFNRERKFILDCTAVSNLSNDYSRVNPKLGSVIPPYNAPKNRYLRFSGTPKTAERSRQSNTHEPIVSRVHDHVQHYLSLRNQFGSGHSTDEIRGHTLFLNDIKPIVNYNGVFGYRRNTPSLRHRPTMGTKLDANNILSIGHDKRNIFHCQCKYNQLCRCHNQDKLCPCIKI